MKSSWFRTWCSWFSAGASGWTSVFSSLDSFTISVAGESLELGVSTARDPVTMVECLLGAWYSLGVSGGLGRSSDWHLRGPRSTGGDTGLALLRVKEQLEICLPPRLSWLLCLRTLFSFLEAGYFSCWYLVRRFWSLEFLLVEALVLCLSGWSIVRV